MNIEDINKQAKKVGRLLTTIETIWSKHWKTLLVIVVITPVIWFCSLVVEEVDNPTEEVDFVGADTSFVIEDHYLATDSVYYLNDTIE
jgi:hypothetical protein